MTAVEVLTGEEALPARELALVEWRHVTAPVAALGFRFIVRSDREVVGQHVERILGALETSPDGTEHVLSVVHRDAEVGEPVELYLDDERLERSSLAGILATLIWTLNRLAIDETPDLLLVHASAAEIGGRAIVMPAPMDSGKTTTVGGPLRAGLNYVTDETVAIDPQTGWLRPYPKPLSVDQGSWDALPELRPNLAPEIEACGQRAWHVDARAIHAGAVAGPCLPHHLVAPMYTPGAATELVPLRKAEAIALLVENSFNFALHGRRGLHAFAALVERSTCHRLIISDLDEACRLVLGLVGQNPS